MTSHITSFPFWTPINLPPDFISVKSNFIENMYQLGCWADQYASLSWEEWDVSYIRIDGRSYDFKLTGKKQVDYLTMVFKVASYAITLFILPAIALVIKFIFKNFLTDLLESSVRLKPNKVIMARQVGNIKVLLLTGDLLNEKTDAIVNAANKNLRAGGGICGIIHDRAGNEPFDDCKEILKQKGKKRIQPGEAVLTSSGDLHPRIKGIIHTPGPDCREKDENDKRRVYLKNCYKNSLKLATDPQANLENISVNHPTPIETISFVSISTGIFKYPLRHASNAAASAIQDFINNNPKTSLKEIHFVFIKKEQSTIDAYKHAFSTIGKPIDLPKKQKGKSFLLSQMKSSDDKKTQTKPAETKKSGADKKAADSNKDSNTTAAGKEKVNRNQQKQKKSDADK